MPDIEQALTDPIALGDSLEAWALQREKILFKLDHRGARAARRLAFRCRALAQRKSAGIESEAWRTEWLRLRKVSAAVLGWTEPASDVSTGVERARPGIDDSPVSERPTRVVAVDLLHARTPDACEETPTRVVTANIWAAQEAMRQALGLRSEPGR